MDEPPRYTRVGDRCDRCGAEAFVLAVVLEVELYFCAHHFAIHEHRLLEVADVVFDDRAWINHSPSPSS